jgi:hypothetical protein
MPEIQAVLDVILNELSSEHQLTLKEAVEQFQQKCLLSFSKNRSCVPFLRTEMPRVLMPGETDATTAAEKQEAFAMVRQAMEEIIAIHNTAFLNSFRQMMVGVFGPSVDNILSEHKGQLVRCLVKHHPRGLMVMRWLMKQQNQVLLLMANHPVKMQVLSRLSKV